MSSQIDKRTFNRFISDMKQIAVLFKGDNKESINSLNYAFLSLRVNNWRAKLDPGHTNSELDTALRIIVASLPGSPQDGYPFELFNCYIEAINAQASFCDPFNLYMEIKTRPMIHPIIEQLTTLTVDNAKIVDTVISLSNPEWGTFRFTYNGQPLTGRSSTGEDERHAHVIGTGSDSRILFYNELQFWKIVSFKGEEVNQKLLNDILQIKKNFYKEPKIKKVKPKL